MLLPVALLCAGLVTALVGPVVAVAAPIVAVATAPVAAPIYLAATSKANDQTQDKESY